MNKKIKWYEPYSNFRKFCWWWCFGYVSATTLYVLLTNNFEYGKNNILIVLINLFCCIISYNNTFEPKESDEK